MEVITSLANPRIKQTARLRERRERELLQRMLIDGIREIGRAVDAQVPIAELYYAPELCPGNAAADLVERLHASGTAIVPVTAKVFEKLAYGDRAEGLLAVAEVPRRSLADLRLPQNPLVVILEALEKPGNLGAIVRTADAVGASAVIVTDPATDLYNPNAIRASVGTIFTTPTCTSTTAATQTWLREHRLSVFATRVEGAIEYTAADFRQGSAIVLGSEAQGLSAAWDAGAATPIRVPMLGHADSLNVSVTAAVILYEALRQRQSSAKTP